MHGRRNAVWVSASSLALLVVCPTPGMAQIVINEILIDPVGNDVGQEKLELRNAGTQVVDLSNWALCNTFLYTLPGDFAGVIMQPGQLLTIHFHSAGTNDNQNVYLPDFPPEIPGFLDGTLGNVVDEISIYDCGSAGCFGALGAFNRMVDYVQWGTTGVGPNEDRHDIAADTTRTGGALWSPGATLDFAPVAPEGSSLSFDGTHGGGGELTLGSNYRVVPPTIGQSNPQCFANSDCNDNIACTNDVCQAGICTFVPQNLLCPSNGLFCDGAEACVVGQGCVSPGSPCTAGQFCNESNDTCSACQQDAHCSDSNPCTIDACTNGSCSHVAVANCCTVNADCLDGNGCTSDACTNGSCQHIAIPECEPCNPQSDDCEDDNSCTDDDCIPECATGVACAFGRCSREPNEDACDDGDPCTVDDRCSDGECVGEASEVCCDVDADCDDLDPCTLNRCEDGQCVFEAISGCSPCDSSIDCDDDNPCTSESCTNGMCDYQFATSSCDDANPCTSTDSCVDGECVGTIIENCCAIDEDCDDQDDCTANVCAGNVCTFPALRDCDEISSGTDDPQDGDAGQDVTDDDPSVGEPSPTNRTGLCGFAGIIGWTMMMFGLGGLRVSHSRS